MSDTASAVRVLVVDDQGVFRDAARAVVDKTAGFILAGEATSGENALAQFPDIQPHLVLMDVRMPGIGGIEAARLIGEQHPDTVVVLLSATPSEAVGGNNGHGSMILDKVRLSPGLLRSAWESSP